MADIAIETDAWRILHMGAHRCGIFWRSLTVGYIVYIDGSNDGNIVYRKTSDGGTTWSATVKLCDPVHEGRGIDAWADWQTPGDAGTKIHIIYTDADEGRVIYNYIDTSTDTVGTRVFVESYGETSMQSSVTREHHCVSITKSRGGKLALAYRWTTNEEPETQVEGFYTSPDGVTWTSKTVPFEDDKDYIQLYCGNEADSDDIWAAFWDKSASEISLKTYDDSGNSWSEQTIASSMVWDDEFLQMDGQVRISDGHLIFAAWSEWDAATADLKVWDINGSGSITAKTNVITNESETFLVSVFINQGNDDIYITYTSGSEARVTTKIFYKKSTDGGATWGSESAMQENAEDDERWISAGCMKSAWEGWFMPVWFNDDLDYLYCNVTNAISTSPAVGWTGKISGVTSPAKVMGVDVANIATVKGVA